MPITAIVFLAGFTAGCILAFTRHPVYGLMTYIATLYFDPAGQWWGHAVLPGVRWELVPAVITLVALALRRGRARSPLFRSGLFRGMLIFIAWILIQYSWAINPEAQDKLITIWSKFMLVSIMICACADSWKHLRLVLWSHVFGCVYMGWIAHAFYNGGRFGGFGLGSITDANTGALQLVTGFLAGAALFLAASRTKKVVLLVGMAFIANAIIATVSRSGFLELGCGGLPFILSAPKAYRLRILAAALVAACGFLILSPANYWGRIQTIKYEGAHVQGVDTGHARIVVLKAQWQMFREHPLGCGHGCTEALSPRYIPKQYLAEGGIRASHNTFMTMLVDQGIPGAILYIVYVWWTFRVIRRVVPEAKKATGIAATFLPAIIGIMLAIVVGDLFSQFPLLEARVWFLSLLVVYEHLLKHGSAAAAPAYDASVATRSGADAEVNANPVAHRRLPPRGMTGWEVPATS
jgi:hypothetical protein